MSLALLYDMHGNLAALDAVLADAREQGADRWFVGGDIAAFGGWPVETVARLDDLEPAVWIRGNWDRWQAEASPTLPDNAVVRAAWKDVVAALGPDLVARLAALATDHRIGSTLLCHGSPKSDVAGFLPVAEDDTDLLAGTDATRVVAGHTHLQFTRTTADGSVEIVNPGSIGLPFDGDVRAAYALLHDDGGVELRRVAYDVERAISRLDVAFPGREWVASTKERLETARF